MKDHVMSKLFLLFLIVLTSFSLATDLYAADSAGQYYAQGVDSANKGDYEKAISLLQRALELSPDDSDAINFELGRLYYITDDCGMADKHLSAFNSASDDENLKHYADGLMDTCGEISSDKSQHIDILTGLQYDTNVLVEPTNPIDKAGQKSDAKAVIYLTAGTEVFDVDGISLTADYSLYQSLHYRLNDYNMQHHQIKPVINFDLSDSFMPSVGYSYEFTRLEYDNYSSVHNVFANVVVPGSEGRSTEFNYEWRNKRYSDSDLYPANTERDGYRQTFGARYNIFTEEAAYGLFVKTAWDKARKNYWSNHMYGGGADLSYRIEDNLNLSVTTMLENRRFDENFPTASHTREDNLFGLSAELTYMLNDMFTLTFANALTVNNSNLDDFTYKRNLTSLFISMGVL